jgi:hypothetical protein
MSQKMNTLLAKVEHGTSRFSKMISDYCQFFKNKQGAFSGVKKTFVPRDGYVEDSRYISNVQVTTTVGEKFNWFENESIPYLKDVFAIEATNSKGAQKIELVVEGVSFGFLTALDLMRLKSILSKKEWDDMYINIPVRSDSDVWEPCTNSEYEGREIFQTPLSQGVTRTTETEEIILKDPNLDPQNLPANYNAKTTIKKKTVETGDYTIQNYTGAWTQRQRAELLRRRSAILNAIVAALKEVNDVPAEQENLNVDKLFNYLHYGNK